MTAEHITYQLTGEIAFIGINRAHKRNALTEDMFDAIGLSAERANDEARVGVLFSHGDNFSAGLDLVHTAQQMASGAFNLDRRQRNKAHAAFNPIARGKIPFVAALNGAVIGAGLELAAAAHIRVADATAYFGLPEGLRGIFVGGGGAMNIQRIVGYPVMADMMLARRIYKADEAVGKNLVQYLVEAGGALAKATELAHIIAQNPPMSNWGVCNLLPRVGDLSQDDGLFLEHVGAHYIVGKESEERLKAFAEKRAEKFNDQ